MSSSNSTSVGSLRRLAPLLRRYRSIVALAVVALLGAAAATLSIPIAVRRMIDFGFADADGGSIDQYFLTLLLISVLLALFTAARFYLVSILGEKVVADIRGQVYQHLLCLTPDFFERTKTGELLSRLTTDTTLIETVVGSSASIAVRNLLLLVGAFAMLLVTSPKLTGLILLGLPVVLIPIITFGRRLRELSRQSQDRVADTSGIAEEALNAVATVQACNQQDYEHRRFDDAVRRALATALRRIAVRAVLTAVVILMVFGAVVIVLWVGAHGVVSGSMSAGELGQFILYAVLLAGATGALSEVWGDVQRAAGAMGRIGELLAERPEVLAPREPLPIPSTHRAAVRFDSVTFSYPSRRDRNVFEELSLNVEPGETVALVGPSGAGKSTLLRLLLRFYDPLGGRILFNGVDLRRVDPTELRDCIGVVPQHPVVFAADAKSNILYGCPGASDQEVFAAARLALADEFISELPDGYDSFLGERGARLSGGQQQRIAIARAIIKNPPLLLLDEATSALDAESEHQIQQALGRVTADRTTIVIAHRLATVQRVNRILVLDHGRIVASGRHEQLMRSDGLYRRLAELQFATQLESLVDASEIA
jgi:ATP-binding cassette subfamily B protein